jgi:hypothetical protein
MTTKRPRKTSEKKKSKGPIQKAAPSKEPFLRAPSADQLIPIKVAPSIKGPKPDPFLDQHCEYAQDPQNMDDKNGNPKYWVRCTGQSAGKRCPQVWATPRQLSRVARHVEKCIYVSRESQRKATAIQAMDAPSTKAGSAAGSGLDPVSSITSSETNTTGPLPIAFKRQTDAAYQHSVDSAVVKLVCGLAIAPYSTDSHWWKDFMKVVSVGRYIPVSGMTLTESHIAKEAAYVRQHTLAYLRSTDVMWITWAFNAGATRRRVGFLTIHAIDDQKRAHFITAADLRGRDHTGQLFCDLVLQVSVQSC